MSQSSSHFTKFTLAMVGKMNLWENWRQALQLCKKEMMKAWIQAVQVIQGGMDAKAMKSLSSVTDDKWKMSQKRSKDSFMPIIGLDDWVHVVALGLYCDFKMNQFSSSVIFNSMDCSTPGFPVHCQLPDTTQSHVYRNGDAIQPTHPLSSPSPPTFNFSQHRGLSNESVLLTRWPKY